MDLVVGGGGPTLSVVGSLLQAGRSVRLVDEFSRTRWGEVEALLQRMGEGKRDTEGDVWAVVWGELRLEIYPVPPDDPYHLEKVLRGVHRVVWVRPMNGTRGMYLAQAERFFSRVLAAKLEAIWVQPPPLARLLFGDLPIRFLPDPAELVQGSR